MLLTHYAGSAISNLIVLAFRQLHEQFRDLMLHFHLAQYCRAIVRDGDLSVRRDEDLVQPYASVEFILSTLAVENVHVPLGPRDVRMILATVLAANIWDCE